MKDYQERLDQYDSESCWQYDIRVRNLEEDLISSRLTKEECASMKVSDFEFLEVTQPFDKERVTKFIERHEWLGTLSQYTTHWFGAYYKGRLAGAILFNVPNTFSKALGEDTPNLERLISRGACISWSPKNLASSFLMWCIKFMVKNTPYRLFTAYSDPSAKELGTIYQACNFFYMGDTFGATKRYINPYNGKIVSDRFFRQKTAYKLYAKELGIVWEKNWNHPTGMCWENMPEGVEARLRAFGKQKQESAKVVELPMKHKYAFVMGKSVTDTKILRKLFLDRNPVYPYPKERGK